MLALCSMKQVKFLILGVIGMIAFTATATTTAKLEDKQKTVLNYEVPFTIEAVGVVNDFHFVAADAVKIFSGYVLPVKNDYDLKIVSAIVTDVGWRSSTAKHTTIHYKEKLLENYNLNFIDNLQKQNLSIRSDC